MQAALPGIMGMSPAMSELMSEPFADMKSTPFWWEEAPRDAGEVDELPASVDVLIVGAGFSGLGAARVLTKAGRSVLVCEADVIGYGASTRNGGMLGPSFHKLGVQGLKAHYLSLIHISEPTRRATISRMPSSA